MEQNLQNLQLPVGIWKIIPTCYQRNKGEVEYISQYSEHGFYKQYSTVEHNFLQVANYYESCCVVTW